MSKIDNGGCTFPQEHGGGMNLREWLAGQALAGFCANEELTMEGPPKIAYWAVQQADAIIKALNATPQEEA